MGLSNHLKVLERKHEDISRQIESLETSQVEHFRVVELKRRKLQLKDEITRLRASAEVVR